MQSALMLILFEENSDQNCDKITKKYALNKVEVSFAKPNHDFTSWKHIN